MTEARKLRVFLCHSSHDKPIVRELYQRLNAEGWIDPWLDKEKLLPGQDWRTEIEQAVEMADIVIICLSKNSVDKESFIQKEMRYAREIASEKPYGTLFLIPLRLDDCDRPHELRSLQCPDYFGDDKEKSYVDLLKSFKIRLDERIYKEEVIRKDTEQKNRLEEQDHARRQSEERIQRENNKRLGHLPHVLVADVEGNTAKEQVIKPENERKKILQTENNTELQESLVSWFAGLAAFMFAFAGLASWLGTLQNSVDKKDSKNNGISNNKTESSTRVDKKNSKQVVVSNNKTKSSNFNADFLSYDDSSEEFSLLEGIKNKKIILAIIGVFGFVCLLAVGCVIVYFLFAYLYPLYKK